MSVGALRPVGIHPEAYSAAPASTEDLAARVGKADHIPTPTRSDYQTLPRQRSGTAVLAFWAECAGGSARTFITGFSALSWGPLLAVRSGSGVEVLPEPCEQVSDRFRVVVGIGEVVLADGGRRRRGPAGIGCGRVFLP
jgi:hypothetical protein